MDLDELRAELDAFAPPPKSEGLTPEEERLIAGFADIVRFFEAHKRLPRQGEARVIFEQLYAVRLEALRGNEAYQTLLASFDTHQLLSTARETDAALEIDEETLVSELKELRPASDLTRLRYVQERSEIRAAEEVADRTPCQDFALFSPLFKQVAKELKAGIRETRRFENKASVLAGDFFILSGQMVYVAHVGEEITHPNGKKDARLRVIYDNVTESALLRRSLQRALNKDEPGRRVSPPNLGPLFANTFEEGDEASGTIYVLRSRSDHPFIAKHRELIHKIGVTSGKVEARIAFASDDPTYLMAEVEVVATYLLANMKPAKFEHLLHRVFSEVQIDIDIPDRFGKLIKPKEWFLVPFTVIDALVSRTLENGAEGLFYDAKTASFMTIAR